MKLKLNPIKKWIKYCNSYKNIYRKKIKNHMLTRYHRLNKAISKINQHESIKFNNKIT